MLQNRNLLNIYDIFDEIIILEALTQIFINKTFMAYLTLQIFLANFPLCVIIKTREATHIINLRIILKIAEVIPCIPKR